MMNYHFKFDNKDVNFEEVTILLKESLDVRKGWDCHTTKKAFEGSSYVIYVYDDQSVIGAARVLSDGYEWTLLGDIVVKKEYRGQGIGTSIVQKILEKYKGHELFAYTYPDKVGFFETAGFKRSKNAFTYSGLQDESLDQILLDDGFFLPLGYKYENDYYPPVGDFPVGKKSELNLSEDKVKYVYNLDGADYTAINSLLELAFGGHSRNPDITKGAFDNSQYYVLAYYDDKLIGCARAVSDGIAQGFILNVAVNPDYQGIHLGWNIVSKLASQMEGQNIFLNTHPGGVGFYNRKGFRRNKTALLYPSNPDMPREIEVGFSLPKGFKFADEY